MPYLLQVWSGLYIFCVIILWMLISMIGANAIVHWRDWKIDEKREEVVVQVVDHHTKFPPLEG